MVHSLATPLALLLQPLLDPVSGSCAESPMHQSQVDEHSGAMEQVSMTGGGFDRKKHGLCLLSLGTAVRSNSILTTDNACVIDGGGIRGLSTLYILQALMCDRTPY